MYSLWKKQRDATREEISPFVKFYPSTSAWQFWRGVDVHGTGGSEQLLAPTFQTEPFSYQRLPVEDEVMFWDYCSMFQPYAVYWKIKCKNELTERIKAVTLGMWSGCQWVYHDNRLHKIIVTGWSRRSFWSYGLSEETTTNHEALESARLALPCILLIFLSELRASNSDSDKPQKPRGGMSFALRIARWLTLNV